MYICGLNSTEFRGIGRCSSDCSDWSKIFAVVPQGQGSILGPLFFLIFINDIVNKIGSCIRVFAEDLPGVLENRGKGYLFQGNRGTKAKF